MNTAKRNRISRALFGFVMAAAALLLVSAAPAFATSAWKIDSLADTTVAPGDNLEFIVQATNVGDEDMDGSEIALTAELPEGMTVIDAKFFPNPTEDPFEINYIGCTAGDGSPLVQGVSEDVRCITSFPLPTTQHRGRLSYQMLRLSAQVEEGVLPDTVLTASFAVAGGGASQGAQTVDPTRVAMTAPDFGIDGFDVAVSDSDSNPVHPSGRAS